MEKSDFLVSIHQKQQQKMPLSTVLLTYELGFADSHLLLGTAVFKGNRALCKGARLASEQESPEWSS